MRSWEGRETEQISCNGQEGTLIRRTGSSFVLSCHGEYRCCCINEGPIFATHPEYISYQCVWSPETGMHKDSPTECFRFSHIIVCEVFFCRFRTTVFVQPKMFIFADSYCGERPQVATLNNCFKVMLPRGVTHPKSPARIESPVPYVA